jgi:hypothetical protein
MSKIYAVRPGSLEDPPEALAELQKWGADRMLRLRRVFGSRAKALVLPLPIDDPAADTSEGAPNGLP